MAFNKTKTSPYSTILRNCRPIYRLGMFVLKIGFVIVSVGLVMGFLGKGWMILSIGVGCAVVGIIIGQAGEGSLANQMKNLDSSLSAKQVHDLAVRHLRATGDDVEDTEVFLGKFVGEMEWQERQKKKQGRGS